VGVLLGQTGIAVVGAGYWGPNLVRNFAADEGCTVRWVCDLDSERAARLAGKFGVEQVTSNLDEVLADTDVSGVAIATPVATHSAIAAACFDAGKDVLIEKPLADSLESGRALVEHAQSVGAILMIDHTFCYTSSVRHIREIVHGGDLGSIHYYDSVRINLGLVQADVDVMWDLAPHDFSIIDFIMPDGVVPVMVSAVGSDPLGVGHACVAYVTVHMSNGAIAHLHLNWLSPVKVRNVIVGGSKRMLVWDDIKPTQRLSIYDAGADLGDMSEPRRREALVAYRIGDMVAPALPEIEALSRVAAEFRNSIETGDPPETDGWSGLRVLAMLDAAQRSLNEGGAPVAVPVIEAGT
jgi:predicted dehydrogenase